MSAISKDSLKTSLLQLECHFTWTLLKTHVSLEALEETILNHIKFLAEYEIRDYNLLSYVNHLKNSNEEALRNLRKAEEAIQKRYPDEIARRSLVTWGNYAWIYYHMQRYEEAQTYVSKVQNSCKKLSSTAHGQIQLPEIYAEQGWTLLRFGRNYFERAKNCFENALQSEPNNSDFSAGYATAMYRLEGNAQWYGGEVRPCLEALKRAVELNPKDTTVMALLALELQRLNRADEGERYIEEGLQKTPDFPIFLRHAANFYRKKKNVNTAMEILKKALALTPKSATLHHQLGLCYRSKVLQLKKTRYPPQEEMENLIQLAIFHFKTAIDKKPVFFSAYSDLAGIYAIGKRYEEAEEIYQKVLQRNGLACDEKQEIYFNYGHFQQFHMKSESKAIKYYIECLKLETDSYPRKRSSEAVETLLKQKIESGLGDATDIGTLGFVHKLNGKKQEAIECYEEAIALDPNNEEYLNALAELRLSISS
ncbi:interferon-induced protein with tetratricopeptide repeats 5-like [Onychostruthus taczanowskii]|uniref:interferon-induced protein with tetratricopeptide repeats 5-like n=1 Tax=Onychostruthus taczanowskii TaxID=356909 RepID=UPI001B802D64|nr:interferon-induced protein with tetratricopeptide repeats 5-like [Onychostruthus taczanowskii]